MHTNPIKMPGYRLNEYMLVLVPHEELRNKIRKVKDEFAEKYNTPLTKYLKSHIALVRFNNWSMMEEKIIQRLQHIALGISPFKIELKDYSCYPSHTIYINVTTKLPVQNLVKELKVAQRLFKCMNDQKPHFLEEPHIGIARKLKPWQFEQAWLEFSHRQFTGRFISDHMLLLKRSEGTHQYQILKRFEFMNLPVSTKQGQLFF